MQVEARWMSVSTSLICFIIQLCGCAMGPVSPAADSALSTFIEDERPTPTTLCEIIREPSDFDGKVVSIRGILLTDHFEFSGLEDRHCPTLLVAIGAQSEIPVVGQEELVEKLARVERDPRVVLELTVVGRIQVRPNTPFRLSPFTRPRIPTFQ